jgi:multidrug efflux system membrane fusion protein
VDGEIQAIDFTEGQKVKAGDTLLQIDPRPFQAQLDQAIAAKARDEAHLANGQLNEQRDASLVKPGYASVQMLDTQKAKVQQLQATVKNDDAQIQYDRVELGYTTITSPIPGVVGLRLVDVGNIVHATDATGIVVVTQTEPISVVVTLPEKVISDIRTHMIKGPLKVLASSEDDRIPLGEGQLLALDNQVDPTSGMIRLKATFPNKDDTLWPGQFVNARVILDDKPDALTIPLAAVQQGAKGAFVYVVTPDSTVAQRPVETGASEHGRTLVLKGLAAAEQVVVEGQSRLEPGARVTIEPAETSVSSTAGSSAP